MIKKIHKLKNFGIFRDFSWSNDIPDFTRFNLIYGWNKSGKTTFSRIFLACEKKTVMFKQYPQDGEFEIKTKDDISIRHSDCQNSSKQIRVFNKDFIDENVSFDPSNPSNPIVYVSEEDIESNKKLKKLRGKVTLLSQKFESAQKNRQKSEKAEDDFRKSTARTIKDIIGNLKVNDKYRDYDKGSVKTMIDNIGVDKFIKLSDLDFEKQKKLISGDQLQSQLLLSKYEIKFSFDSKNLSSFSNLHDELSRLLKRQVVAETIVRFKDDSDLNKWVQHGFELHKKKNEMEKCLFCQNKFFEGFLESLSKHFSNDYEKLQGDITSFKHELSGLKKEKIAEKDLLLYADLQDDYKDKAEILNKTITELNTWIDEAVKKLNVKYDSPHSIVEIPKSPKDFKEFYDKTVEEINTTITDHNSKVINHEKEVKKAKGVLEDHLIANAIEDQDYPKIKEEYGSSVEGEKKAKNEMEEKKSSLS